MASRRNILISTSAVLGLAALGAVIFVVARQGDGNQELAQAPLNIETQIKPAFIMAVDDSGSMTYQVLLRGLDGGACWSSSADSFYSGTDLRTCTDIGNNYWYVMPHAGYTASRDGRGLPPLDAFGFARSPEINPSYFSPDPSVTYGPWLQSDGSPQTTANTDANGNATITATRADPRDASPTFDFTQFLTASNSAYRFELRDGMRLPVGIQYYTTSNCGGMGGTSSRRNTWVPVSSALDVSGTCDVGLRYFPATFYLKTGTAAPAGYRTAVVAPDSQNRAMSGRVLAQDACGNNCDMYRYEIRPENYTSTAAYNAAIQKFANWFSYYGNRNRAMIAGMTRSMADINKMYVGYFTLKNRTALVAMRDMQSPTDKSSLYADLMGLPASGGTPNLAAVDHIGKQFQRTDDAAPVKLSCQKNAGMLFTDGFSNDGTPGAPAVTGLGAPFDPTPADSMAAIASRYYLNTNQTIGAGGVSNLRTGTAFPSGLVDVPAVCATLDVNSVEWKRLDCQTNLHMNFYGITLGARGVAFDPDVDRDPYVSPSPAWPSHTNDSPTAIDDIWHATVNTRGEFINAKSPADITAAMRRVLESVGSGSTPSGSIALTGSRVGSNSLSVVPFYASANNGTDWYSTLTAQAVTRSAATGEVTFAKSWEATEQLPGYAARNIRVAKTSGSVVPAVTAFDTSVTLDNLCSNATFARCTAATITALGVNLTQAIAYLRGDQSLEAGGTLRRRTKVLGDIVNSSPVVSATSDDYGYRSLRGSTAGTFNPYAYENYLTTKKTRTAMVYAAANDGMLHAFNGTTGVEQFAYIPATAVGHMGNLLTPYSATADADQKFQHRYYVDGPISVSDAYLGSAWKTVLVGTAGAGGRGVFALDVSTPASFGDTSVLWEINDQVTDTAIKNNIGHVLGKPIIVPVKIGTTVAWKAIFGNGYGSVNGKARLFVVNLADGAVTTVLADEADATLPSKNGLGNVIVLDRYVGSTTVKASDGYGDTVYAGDQNGAVWKFDLRTATPAAQSTPFYIAKDAAGNRQSIMGGFAAASGPGGGVVVYFGTGSFSFTNDGTDTAMQSLYGVQDRETTGYTVSGRTQLQQQTVMVDSAGDRTITTNASAAGTKGWYLDLGVTGTGTSAVAQGERSVGNPAIEGGVVFFPTYQPTVASGCGTTGINRIYGLNALSGGAALSQVRIGSPTAAPTGSTTGALALNTGGSAPVKDVAVLTTARFSPLTCVPGTAGCTETLPPGTGCSMVVQVAGAPPMYLPRPCGRQSWRQVR